MLAAEATLIADGTAEVACSDVARIFVVVAGKAELCLANCCSGLVRGKAALALY